MSIFRRIVEMLRKIFVRSTFIHLYQDPAPTTEALVNLMDRFVDGTPEYDLEWDDFLSWESNNPHTEIVRQRLSQFEPLLFSKDPSEKRRYRNHVIRERNNLAVLIGLKERSLLPVAWTFKGIRYRKGSR
jgi:hypothetical protein